MRSDPSSRCCHPFDRGCDGVLLKVVVSPGIKPRLAPSQGAVIFISLRDEMVGPAGNDPATFRLKGGYSAS